MQVLDDVEITLHVQLCIKLSDLCYLTWFCGAVHYTVFQDYTLGDQLVYQKLRLLVCTLALIILIHLGYQEYSVFIFDSFQQIIHFLHKIEVSIKQNIITRNTNPLLRFIYWFRSLWLLLHLLLSICSLLIYLLLSILLPTVLLIVWLILLDANMWVICEQDVV